MTNFKEIVTKTVIGKHHKPTAEMVSIECEEVPNTVLGCWIINHAFKGLNNGGKTLITGSYDVNVWYSYDNDSKTKVSSKTYTYNDTLNINNVDLNSELIVSCLKQPTATDVKNNDKIVTIKVEKDMGIEIIGNATIRVATEDNYDDYEEIIDEEDEKELDIKIDDLDENYLTVNK